MLTHQEMVNFWTNDRYLSEDRETLREDATLQIIKSYENGALISDIKDEIETLFIIRDGENLNEARYVEKTVSDLIAENRIISGTENGTMQTRLFPAS